MHSNCMPEKFPANSDPSVWCVDPRSEVQSLSAHRHSRVRGPFLLYFVMVSHACRGVLLVCLLVKVACGGDSNDQGDAGQDDAANPSDATNDAPTDAPNPDNVQLSTLSAEELDAACDQVKAITDAASDVFSKQNFCEILALPVTDSEEACEDYVADCIPDVVIEDPIKIAGQRCVKEIQAMDASCTAGTVDLATCIQKTVDGFRFIMESTDCSTTGSAPGTTIPPECIPIYACDLFWFLEDYGQ